MKKCRTVLFIVILATVLTACGGPQGNIHADDRTETLIVTSFYPLYIFTGNIAKDIQGVKVVNMTEPQTGCLHDYQLVPADLKVLEKADIFVINGAGMESFLDKVISQLPQLKIVEASKGMELLGGDHADHDHDENDGHDHEDHDHDEPNPHVWVGITGAIEEVKNITEALTEMDPSNGPAYQKNGREYIQRLEALREEMHSALKDIKTRDIVTFHEAFPYFAQEFDLNIVSVVEREPGTEPSAGELAETIKTINELEVKVLFVEPQYSTRAAQSIANETGAEIYVLDPVVTGAKDAPLDSYEKTMRENLKALTEALK